MKDGAAKHLLPGSCGQFQSGTSVQANPTPDQTLTLNPNPSPLGGSRSVRAVARPRSLFWWRLSQKKWRAERPASTNQTNDLHVRLVGNEGMSDQRQPQDT